MTADYKMRLVTHREVLPVVMGNRCSFSGSSNNNISTHSRSGEEAVLLAANLQFKQI